MFLLLLYYVRPAENPSVSEEIQAGVFAPVFLLKWSYTFQ